jgi:ABC-type transport system substrate-binding protein
MILAEYPDGIQTKIQYRNVIRGYQPLAPQMAQDLQLQLADIGITATIDEQESSTFIDNSNQGLLDGLFMLGWGADYPEITNFMDYHFGPGCTSAFGACMPEIADQLAIGNSTAVESEREAAYTAANNAIRDLVPMVPIAHGAFANAYVAGLDVAQASPLSNELLFRMAPPDGDTVVFMQNAEPGTVFCADETDGEALRACEQSMESLYAFKINGSEVEPALAESCTPNDDATVWTCALRQGVTFHNGATFDAHDVITSFALQWDAANPLHKGKTSQFEYWTGLWGDFLHKSAQPAPPES